MQKISSGQQQFFILATVMLGGLLVRLYFQMGHIFSDDAYYSYLSYTFLYSDFPPYYLGYPVFPLRIGFLGLGALSMKIFGVNEFATLFFPFLFSLLGILVTFKLTKLLTKSVGIAISAAMMMAFFPTDVIFASIGFPDLLNIFFINLGAYFLFNSHSQSKHFHAYLGGLSLFLSMQFKENIYYVFILLVILFAYNLLKNKKINLTILIGVLFVACNYLIEGFIYLLLHNDFFYRITVTNFNYNYSFYDFFPYTARKFSGSKNYFLNLFDQIFLINAKSFFLRRFYLFLPMVAVVQTFFNFRRNVQPLLTFWFWGTAILMIALTTSLSEYKPLDLARSWYVYPVLMPIIILASIFINRFSKLIRYGFMIVYILGSLIMCFEYQTFFNKENLTLLKTFLRENTTRVIYTDHFTKYSVDLIRGYDSDSKRILGSEFNFSEIANGDWILFNNKHIEELQMQKYQFPDFDVLNTSSFKKVASFNDFIFYEKLH